MALQEDFRKHNADRAASILRTVADNILTYLPEAVMLEGSELVVRIPDANEIPTVVLTGSMPAEWPINPPDHRATVEAGD